MTDLPITNLQELLLVALVALAGFLSFMTTRD